MIEKVKPLEMVFTVRAMETAPDGKSFLFSIGDYLQEAASFHAASFGVGVDLFRSQGITWVLSRMRIQVERYPEGEEKLTVVTWPTFVRRVMVGRDFLVRDQQGEVIVRAVSGWFILDLERGRPVPPSEELKTLYHSWDAPRALAEEFENRLDRPEEILWRDESPVRYSELDINGHLNNVRFLQRMVDALPKEWVEAHRIADLTAEFRQPAQWGERILAETSRVGEEELLHRFTRPGEENPLFLAKTLWRENP